MHVQYKYILKYSIHWYDIRAKGPNYFLHLPWIEFNIIKMQDCASNPIERCFLRFLTLIFLRLSDKINDISWIIVIYQMHIAYTTLIREKRTICTFRCFAVCLPFMFYTNTVVHVEWRKCGCDSCVLIYTNNCLWYIHSGWGVRCSWKNCTTGKIVITHLLWSIAYEQSSDIDIFFIHRSAENYSKYNYIALSPFPADLCFHFANSIYYCFFFCFNIGCRKIAVLLV